MKTISLAIALLAALVGAPTVGLAQGGPGLDEVRDQGVLYFKRKHLKQAKVQLDKAYKMEGGSVDFATVYYRGKAAFKLLLLEQAFEMGAKAEKLAGDNPRHMRRAKEMRAEMSELFGGVTLTLAKGETNTRGRVFFEAKTGIINRAKKKRFFSIRERFRSTDIELPTTVYLPYGDYLANKVPFSLVQGEPVPQVDLFLQVVVTKKPVKSKMWWYVGIGGAAAVVGGVAAFILLDDPGTDVEERIRFRSQPLGTF